MDTSTRDQLRKALAAHGAWKTRLKSAIDSGRSDLDAADVARDDRCEFGKWLYGTSTPEERRSPHFASCRAAHRDFHRAAAAVLALALAGDRAGAERALGFGSDFARASAGIAKEVMGWEKELTS